jgi:hypothetical protein
MSNIGDHCRLKGGIFCAFGVIRGLILVEQNKD